MTGRNPSHTGLGPEVIQPLRPYSIQGDEMFLPQKMKELGYRTSMVGKWHLGFCDERHTPTWRGFENFLGLFTGEEYYFTHERPEPMPGFFQSEEEERFYAGKNRTTSLGYSMSGLDFRSSGPADSFDQERVLPARCDDYDGEHSTTVFSSRANQVLEAHQKIGDGKPLFLYLSFQNPHAPLEAPDEYVDMYPSNLGAKRQTYAALTTIMDDAVGSVVQQLKNLTMYDDTVIIFTTDNGGLNYYGGNNFPLRGQKKHVFEGGVRAIGFVKGSASHPIRAGTVNNVLLHSSDWYPSIIEGIAGGVAQDGAQALDGFNAWPAIAGLTDLTGRQYLVHNCPKKGLALSGSIRKGDYKLIFSNGTDPDMQAPTGTIQVQPSTFSTRDFMCDLPGPFNSVWLFNIAADPTECHNLASEQWDVVEELSADLYAYQEGGAVEDMALTFPYEDSAGNPAAREDRAWGPFADGSQCVYVGASILNEGADCWNRCEGRAGACPSFCGARGGCCIAGGSECEGSAGCSGYHCCAALFSS